MQELFLLNTPYSECVCYETTKNVLQQQIIQQKINDIKNIGYIHRINIYSCDLEKNLDEILYEYKEWKIYAYYQFETSIDNFDYLTSQSWFVNNLNLQRKLLLIVELGLGHKVISTSSYLDYDLDYNLNRIWLNHYYKLLCTCIDNFSYLLTKVWFQMNFNIMHKILILVYLDLCYKINVYSENIIYHINSLWYNYVYEIFDLNIKYFRYLKEFVWFNDDIMLQKKILLLIQLNLGNKINVFSINIWKHIDDLWRHYAFWHFEQHIFNFSYLKYCNWFVLNFNIQEKLLLLVKLGLGAQIKTYSENFIQHINNLLNKYL